mmetsp:Transcript_44031/g.131987  ORF Transcript_44031/g.131987 Transcript_44031/m.131987 type:complete len:390 (+) Transcript_44031:541-1710(+)
MRSQSPETDTRKPSCRATPEAMKTGAWSRRWRAGPAGVPQRRAKLGGCHDGAADGRHAERRNDLVKHLVHLGRDDGAVGRHRGARHDAAVHEPLPERQLRVCATRHQQQVVEQKVAHEVAQLLAVVLVLPQERQLRRIPLHLIGRHIVGVAVGMQPQRHSKWRVTIVRIHLWHWRREQCCRRGRAEGGTQVAHILVRLNRVNHGVVIQLPLNVARREHEQHRALLLGQKRPTLVERLLRLLVAEESAVGDVQPLANAVQLLGHGAQLGADLVRVGPQARVELWEHDVRALHRARVLLSVLLWQRLVVVPLAPLDEVGARLGAELEARVGRPASAWVERRAQRLHEAASGRHAVDDGSAGRLKGGAAALLARGRKGMGKAESSRPFELGG